MTAPEIVLLTAYATLIVELVAFAVPSVASTRQLLNAEPGSTAHGGDHLERGMRRSTLQKALVFLLPTALGVALFCVPPVTVFAPAILDYLVPIDALRQPAVAWIGAALCAAGRVITFSAMRQLHASHERGDLQPDGLFAVSRNPGLLGMFAFYLGACLVVPSAVLLLGFLPYFINMHHRVLMEESHLVRTLGESYRTYLRQVPRYLLFR